MDLQQKFGERLLNLLEEKNISQGDFAEKLECSRQSINFYILGKRSPDIALAAKMAQYLGVSCDYLIGYSDFRTDKEANFTVNQVGLTEDTMKFFAGLNLSAMGKAAQEEEKFKTLEFDYEKEVLPYQMEHASKTLNLLNDLISHDSFGILLQYIKRYWDVSHGEDDLTILKDFMFELEPPFTNKNHASKEENIKMMQDFCLYVSSNYFNEIVRDISKC